MIRRALLALPFLILVSSAAHADGEIESLITAADKARLAQFDTTRSAAIADARARGAAADVATLDTVLAGDALPFAESFNPIGDWRCRTIKLGGDPALVIYGWFNCRISDDESGWRLEKPTGSQRTSGRFFTESDTRLTYLGALHYRDEQPKAYGSEAERDQVAYAVRAGQDRLRLEFPLPQYESKLDILELQR
jgi:hypothetical protein